MDKEVDGILVAAHELKAPLSVLRQLALAFDKMDDGETHELARAICAHVSAKYWPECTPEQIAEMAGKMID